MSGIKLFCYQEGLIFPFLPLYTHISGSNLDLVCSARREKSKSSPHKNSKVVNILVIVLVLLLVIADVPGQSKPCILTKQKAQAKSFVYVNPHEGTPTHPTATHCTLQKVEKEAPIRARAPNFSLKVTSSSYNNIPNKKLITLFDNYLILALRS